jgi:hypothetical protein
MTDDMIERVARALRHAESYDASFSEMARGAIEAMREPTDAMREAGRTTYTGFGAWQAMIDAALGKN